MSIWSRIAQAVSALASGESLTAIFERLRTPPERSIGFTIAVIALGAKMAKADGHVTRDEVAAFREVFMIPASEEKNAARIFNLARQDVAGFEAYAAKIAGMFPPKDPVLEDLMDGLFYIAVADGEFHPNEEAFLRRVAEILKIPAPLFSRLCARHVEHASADPYAVLGVDPGASMPEIRQAWRALVRQTHPDAMIARGVPEEAVRIATRRLAEVNDAWEQISRDAA